MMSTPLDSTAGSGIGDLGLDRLLPMLAIALPIGTMIQLLLPVGPAGLAVTLSDAVVAAALPVMALRVLQGWRPQVICLVPRLPLWLGIMTIALAAGFLVGYARLGFNTWGATRLFGWFVLLAHVGVAAWIASSEDVRRFALRVFILGAAACAGVEFIKTLHQSVFINQESCGWSTRAFGLMQNPNAFGFVLLIAAAAAIGEIRRAHLCHPKADDIIVVLLAIGIGLTASRSAAVALLLTASVAFFFGWTQRMRVGIDLVLGVLILVLLFAVLVCGKTSAVSESAQVVVTVVNEQKLDGSNIERLYTWRSAIEMFIANPVLGAGFGAFLKGEVARGSTPLIIHSTFLWLLAEGGLINAAAYVAMGVGVALPLFRRARQEASDTRDDAITATLVVVAFAIMSMLQELLYQRCVWVVLGLLIFQPFMSRKEPVR